MPTFKVNIKWGRELYKEVEVSTDEDPMVFRAQIYALTGILPERQKIMFKGATLKNETWDNMKLQDNCTILLMGSKEEDVPSEPVVKTRFVEDMNEAELAEVFSLPAGLSNLGNTCYMNAVVQCLKTVPELRTSLKQFKGSITGGTISAQSVTAALRDLYELMDKGASVPPIMLLQVLQMVFPRFAEKNENGSFIQQDANECWTEMLRLLQQKLDPIKKNEETSTNNKYKNFIDQYFGGIFQVEYKCDETDSESVKKVEENFLQLSCFISQDVKYMHNGIVSRMHDKLTKHSEALGRDAVFTKTVKISRLPAYLTVQFVRFFYKEKEAVNAKILKEVKYPMEFDVFELCSKDLQEKLLPMRKKLKDFDDKKAMEEKVKKNVGKANEKTDEKDKNVKKMKKENYWFDDDIGSNNSGWYTLQAVLTHRGRSSSSGHYVAWVKQSEDLWIKCDDDSVSSVPTEAILKLCGGGDWHVAYLLLYGPRILEVPLEETEPSTTL